jgi:hypothetical protein
MLLQNAGKTTNVATVETRLHLYITVLGEYEIENSKL